MSIILNPRQVQQALDATHGRELIELLKYMTPYEGDPEAYLVQSSAWLICHGKVKPENGSLLPIGDGA